ncbi:5-formyltetrahydrofolate cyclo-ligase [Fredinandcohnia humi]
MRTKREIRNEIKETLLSLDQELYQKWSKEIIEKVISLPEWKNAKTIGITVSGKYEVNTEPLVKTAWETGKKVAVPKCHPLTKTMTFREITNFTQLEVVYYGLKEPIESITVEVPHNKIDLLLVPGLCFTNQGYRLGHGGGYYDRYLTTYRGDTLSLAFPVQLVENFPIEPFDIPVKKLVTPTQVKNCHE